MLLQKRCQGEVVSTDNWFHCSERVRLPTGDVMTKVTMSIRNSHDYSEGRSHGKTRKSCRLWFLGQLWSLPGCNVYDNGSKREWKFPLVEPNHAPSGLHWQRKPHQETSHVVWIIPQSAFQMLLCYITDRFIVSNAYIRRILVSINMKSLSKMHIIMAWESTCRIGMFYTTVTYIPVKIEWH